MDDDLRNRFRSTRRSYDTAPLRRAPAPPRPAAPAQQPASAPAPDPAWARQQPAAPRPEPAQMVPQAEPPKAKKPRRSRGRKAGSLRKKILVAVPVMLLVVGGFGASKLLKKKPATNNANQTQVQSATTKEESPKVTGTVRMVAVGDSLAFESINNAGRAGGYAPMMANFKPLFEKADIRLCNETTIGGGEALGISGYPSFNSPVSWSTGFAETGCNLMNLGSDHTNDKGQPGIDAMVSTWASQPSVLAYAGANRSAEEQAKIRYFTVKDTKFAYVSYTTRSIQAGGTPFGVNLYNTDAAKQQIAEARKNAKLVLVSITWGNEDQAAISGDQERVAQELATAGADVVLGGGPHVLQPAKILDGEQGHQTLVWFSLGNFLNSQLPVSNLIGGMAVMDFDIGTGQLRDPKLMPVYMHYEWTAAQKAAGTVNARTNFKLYPLDLATEALAKSQNGTTVEAQTKRVSDVVTSAAPIKIIKSTEL